ncbi:transcriptional regulator with XRE-family HTH domain [Natronobacillus azotifigens]|uniref:HTH cro/C1-type domain-containing protein n=1 Tax=Natronobacillus azotifigens TaxID=472978 RepID=A0A9J6RCG5_9BACI|nr:helix-turn-helix transcriptional regulator [Natronobacillus azotifigens]MCZ0703043.1 hypothetical protein [Natronobacillus azotifigens]
MAEASNLHHNFVGEIEHGVKLPSLFTFHKIVLALDIDAHQLKDIEEIIEMEQFLTDDLDSME